MVFHWDTQLRGCFAKRDSRKDVSLKYTQVKGSFAIPNHKKMHGDIQKGYKYDPTDSGSPSVSLPCSTLLVFALHYIAELSFWWLHRNSPKNFSWGSCCFLPLWRTLASWQASQVLWDWAAFAGSCVVSAKWTWLPTLLVCMQCLLVDWTETNEDCSPQSIISKQVYFPDS